MSDPLKKIADKFDAMETKKLPTKATRTLKLNNENFVVLQKYCQRRGVAVSEVVDELIEQFLQLADTTDF